MNIDKEEKVMWRRLAMILLVTLPLVMGISIQAITKSEDDERTIRIHVGQIVPYHLKPEKVQEHAGCTVYRTMEQDNISYWVDCKPYGVTSFSIQK